MKKKSLNYIFNYKSVNRNRPQDFIAQACNYPSVAVCEPLMCCNCVNLAASTCPQLSVRMPDSTQSASLSLSLSLSPIHVFACDCFFWGVVVLGFAPLSTTVCIYIVKEW